MGIDVDDYLIDKAREKYKNALIVDEGLNRSGSICSPASSNATLDDIVVTPPVPDIAADCHARSQSTGPLDSDTEAKTPAESVCLQFAFVCGDIMQQHMQPEIRRLLQCNCGLSSLSSDSRFTLASCMSVTMWIHIHHGGMARPLSIHPTAAATAR